MQKPISSLMAVGLLLLAACGSTEVADSDSRVVQLTFDGEQCIYEGPSVLSAGEGQVEVVFHNESSEDSFFIFGRLDEGRTTQEIIEYIAVDPSRQAPSWWFDVWKQERMAANSSSIPVMRTVAPGLHNLVCGTEASSSLPQHVYFGGELTVTP